MNPYLQELAERHKNFYGSSDDEVAELLKDENYFSDLWGTVQCLEADIESLKTDNKTQILNLALVRVFKLVVLSDPSFVIFSEASPFYTEAYVACCFATLCLFIHLSRRIKRNTIREFQNEFSPLKYDKFQSQYDPEESERARFRQARQRILSSRPVYIKGTAWVAMSSDSLNEWSLYYRLENEPALKKIFKRIGNLNTDILKVIESKDCTKAAIENALRKYQSKVEKLHFKDYLELQKFCIDNILKDPKYYGMNIYRLEKRLSPYKIICEINQLINCENVEEECRFFDQSMAFQHIFYPQLYKALINSFDFDYAVSYAHLFPFFSNTFYVSSRLVIDYMIDGNYFGNEWESFLLNHINKMAESVFYNPADIDYSTTPESQDAFEKILTAPVRHLISLKIAEIELKEKNK